MQARGAQAAAEAANYKVPKGGEAFNWRSMTPELRDFVSAGLETRRPEWLVCATPRSACLRAFLVGSAAAPPHMQRNWHSASNPPPVGPD